MKEQTPQKYRDNFEHSGVSALEQLIRIFASDDKPATLVALFDGRASPNSIRSWRNGWRTMPPWAIELMRAKADQASALVEQLPAGPGSASTWRNLSSWRAANAPD